MKDVFDKFYDVYSSEYARLSVEFYKNIEHGNLTVNQVEYLTIINNYDSVRVSTLADDIGHSKASTSVMISKLEKMSLVKRVKDDMDKRAIRVTLTEKARKIIEIERRVFHEIGKVIFKGLTGDEQETFRYLIMKSLDEVAE